MPVTITLEQLERLNACEDQLVLFALTFGQSVTLTEANIRADVLVGFDVDWASYHLLPPRLWRVYDDARRPLRRSFAGVFGDARRPLREAYEKDCALLLLRLLEKEEAP